MMYVFYLPLNRRVMTEKLKKIGENIHEEKIALTNADENELTVEKLKELLGNKTMSEIEAKEIIFAINILVDIIIDFQYEQESKENNEEDFNLNQAA